jgi:hypothetical protein
MDFSDELRKLVNENGGTSPENLRRIAQKAALVTEDFTTQYLVRLLNGHPPRPVDREAVTQTLEGPSDRWLSEYWLLEDEESRRIANVAVKELISHVLVKQFVDDIAQRGRFRNRILSESELRILLVEFRLQNQLEVDIDVFGLEQTDA